MTPFVLTLTELSSVSSLQNGLPLPLAAPITVQGNINNKALKEEFIQHLASNKGLDNVNSENIDATNPSGIDNKKQDQGLNESQSTNPIHIKKKQSLRLNIGIDEVGRGPLYGSVVVSAAILPTLWSAEVEFKPLQDTQLSILTDSKKLTELKRERLFDPIKQHALAYMIVEIPAAVIDDINILQATLLGMRLAAEQAMIQVVQLLAADSNLSSQLSIDFNLLIDGNKVPEFDGQLLQQFAIGEGLTHKVNAEAWVKGDARHSAIAAASVLAKVSRDRQLIEDAKLYPGYGLEGHKGYPTKNHLVAIEQLGVLPQHRRSFRPIKEALETQFIKNSIH